MAAKVSPEEQGFPAPHQAFQPKVSVPGREVPITSGYKTSEVEAEGHGVLLESQAVPLKGPACGLTQIHAF